MRESSTIVASLCRTPRLKHWFTKMLASGLGRQSWKSFISKLVTTSSQTRSRPDARTTLSAYKRGPLVKITFCPDNLRTSSLMLPSYAMYGVGSKSWVSVRNFTGSTWWMRQSAIKVAPYFAQYCVLSALASSRVILSSRAIKSFIRKWMARSIPLEASNKVSSRSKNHSFVIIAQKKGKNRHKKSPSIRLQQVTNTVELRKQEGGCPSSFLFLRRLVLAQAWGHSLRTTYFVAENLGQI